MPKIKILMFGWEFPPFNSGGLGVACEGLVRALCQEEIKVIFVLPQKVDCKSPFCRIVFASDFKKVKINALVSALVSAYVTSESYRTLVDEIESRGIYGANLFEEVARYAKVAKKIALTEEFDIIHVHDWLSFPAGLAAKWVSRKPLVVHAHATEFDRTGGDNVNHHVYEIEKKGFREADVVVTVSNFTKEKIINHYGIKPEKVQVVHNATDFESDHSLSFSGLKSRLKDGSKVVLFLGRLTLQKGPDYFLKAAKKVLEYNPNVFFVIAGSGDMKIQLINQAVELGIADKVIFTGFLRGSELTEIYRLADLYVLPSVSEPFGLTVLESLKNGTPVLISKQSGVCEVLNHCLKVDFWDIDQLANNILAVLNYEELHQSLKENGSAEIHKFSWQDSARKCLQIYQELLSA